MSKKDLSLKKYNISKERYRELKYFCLQYEEWKRQLSFGVSLQPQKLTGMPNAKNAPSNPTEDAAVKLYELRDKCALVEQTAIEADAELYRYILKNVTQGVPYEYMPVPCCRQKFYNARKKFFYKLSKKR